jgi:uncharacterized membrane protein (UPF0127 family)
MGEKRGSSFQRHSETKKREKQKAEQGKLCEQRGMIEVTETIEQRLRGMIGMSEMSEKRGMIGERDE